MPNSPNRSGLTEMELSRILRMPAIEELTSLSHDTIQRRFPQYIVKLSPRRKGMRLRDVLKITDGIA